MKAKLLHSALSCLLIAICGSAHAQGTAFTYQGRLNDGANQANGSYDLVFSVWNAASGPAQFGGTLTNTATAVSNGLFTATLDFGNQFPGADRWLEMGVRTNGGGAFTILNPRQKITATPYAITASNLTGTLPTAQLSGAIPSANLAGTYASALTLNNPANSFTGNGAGLTHLNASQLTNGVVPDARLSANVSLLGSSIESGEISDGTIVNADISPSAAIADTKLATLATVGKVANSATTANTANSPNTIVLRDGTGGIFAGAITASNLFGNGAGLTSLNASQLTSGTVPDARLSNNLARLNVANTFTAAQTITNGGQVPLQVLGNDVGGTWLNLANSSVNGRTWNFISSGSGNSEGAGKLLLRDSAQGVLMTLSTNGYVGIGTSEPATKLHVVGSITANSYAGNGAGLSNVVAQGLSTAGALAFWQLNGNTGTTQGVHFIGTTDERETELRANNTTALRLSRINTTGIPNLIGGFGGNSVAGGSQGAVIGGGGAPGATNRIVSGNVTTISGGSGNTVSAEGGVIGGGTGNSVSGQYSTVSGGQTNSASGEGATVSGGSGNVASGGYSTAMGINTTASGWWSTAMGYNTTASGHAATAWGIGTTASGESSTAMGAATTASGSTSMAMGYRARALHEGSFVWADSQNADFASTGANQLLIRAAGGVGIGTTSVPHGLLVVNGDTHINDANIYLRGGTDTAHGLGWYGSGKDFGGQTPDGPVLYGYAGGLLGTQDGGRNWSLRWDASGNIYTRGVLNPPSDRNAKEEFVAVNPGEVLQKVAALPLSTWAYKDSDGTRHIGPMAQDFHAAFGLGTDDKHIATVDADGVALAAIQGLNQKVDDRETALRAEIAELKRELSNFKKMLTNQKLREQEVKP